MPLIMVEQDHLVFEIDRARIDGSNIERARVCKLAKLRGQELEGNRASV